MNSFFGEFERLNQRLRYEILKIYYFFLKLFRDKVSGV
jgi:hypothetical protein